MEALMEKIADNEKQGHDHLAPSHCSKSILLSILCDASILICDDFPSNGYYRMILKTQIARNKCVCVEVGIML